MMFDTGSAITGADNSSSVTRPKLKVSLSTYLEHPAFAGNKLMAVPPKPLTPARRNLHLRHDLFVLIIISDDSNSSQCTFKGTNATAGCPHGSWNADRVVRSLKDVKCVLDCF